jgi:hypothetical protein
MEPAMNRTIATVCALAIVSGGLFALQSAPPSSNAPKTPAAQHKSVGKKPASRKKVASKPAAAHLLPAQEMPPVPANLMNSAPVKPSVTMDGGMLTIDAPNSTLSDVLSGVHKATGASIEGVTPTERVVVKIGPGDPGLVLASLLRGTPYGYVILGAPGKPDALTRVMLTPQSSLGASGASPETGSQPAQSPNRGVGPSHGMLSPRQPESGDAAMPDRPSGDEAAPENNEDEQAAQPPQQPTQPQTAQPDAQPTAQPDANAPKTPEQLFKELQQLNQKPQQQQPQE